MNKSEDNDQQSPAHNDNGQCERLDVEAGQNARHKKCETLPEIYVGTVGGGGSHPGHPQEKHHSLDHIIPMCSEKIAISRFPKHSGVQFGG